MMERSLLWSGFALGWAGWLCAMLLPASKKQSEPAPRPYLTAAIGLPILIFILTLPSKPPFAEGQGFGRGFLIGAICALLAYWALVRLGTDENPLRQAAAATAPLFLALV